MFNEKTWKILFVREEYQSYVQGILWKLLSGGMEHIRDFCSLNSSPTKQLTSCPEGQSPTHAALWSDKFILLSRKYGSSDKFESLIHLVDISEVFLILFFCHNHIKQN